MPTCANSGTLNDYPGVLTYRVTNEGRAEVCRCSVHWFRADLWPLDLNFLCSCVLNGKQEKHFRQEVWILRRCRTLQVYLPKIKESEISDSCPERR